MMLAYLIHLGVSYLRGTRHFYTEWHIRRQDAHALRRGVNSDTLATG